MLLKSNFSNSNLHSKNPFQKQQQSQKILLQDQKIMTNNSSQVNQIIYNRNVCQDMKNAIKNITHKLRKRL